MQPARFAVFVLSVFLLAACATTSHVITGTARTPIDPSQVKVYSTTPPNYEEIAVIDATSRLSGSFGDQKKMDTVIERLKKEAASLGANGVVLQTTGVGTWRWGGHGSGGRRRRNIDRHRHFYGERQQDRPRSGDLRSVANAPIAGQRLSSGAGGGSFCA